VYNLFKPAGAPDFVVFFVEHANGATILLSAEQISLTERKVYAPCSPDEIAEDDPYAACEVYHLSSHNKRHAKQLSDFVSIARSPRLLFIMCYITHSALSYRAPRHR
jgi:hypothetical protein